MPELAAGFAVGILFTLLISMVNVALLFRDYTSEAYQILGENLARIEKFWSLNSATIIELSGKSWRQALKEDRDQSLKSALIFSTLMIFLSWFGFLFSLLYILSSRWLAKSRTEKKIFNSQLANEKNLDPEVIRSFICTIN